MHVPIDAKIKPNFRPIILINFAAKKANNAIPTTDKAIGRVAKDFIGLNFEPIIPLKKTVTGAAVKAKIWLNISNERFLFIKRINTYQPYTCLLYTSPSPRDTERSRMPSSA